MCLTKDDTTSFIANSSQFVVENSIEEASAKEATTTKGNIQQKKNDNMVEDNTISISQNQARFEE